MPPMADVGHRYEGGSSLFCRTDCERDSGRQMTRRLCHRWQMSGTATRGGVRYSAELIVSAIAVDR
ncbi:MAG: hypothetical protein IJD91_02460 [Clostridia bacterium]|nr:hypothetical protein [Clostridia bacterium]